MTVAIPLSLKKEVPVSLTEVQLGAYVTVRNNVTTYIHVIGVKGDTVTYKESLDRTDSATIPLAKFQKFYSKV